MSRTIQGALAILLLVIGFWPPAGSLFGFTGEEERLGQARGVVQWMYTAVRPPLQLAPESAVGDTIRPYGVNTFLEQEALPEVRDESLRLAKEAGFGVIRQQFPWFDIEIHAKGDFVDRRNDPNGVDAWLKYDNIVDLAEKNEIQILARIDHPPAWSRERPEEEAGAFGPSDTVEDFADFVFTVASRYEGRIRYYQLWNEPNIYPEWGEQAVNPEDFTAFLCAGYDAVKRADPEAVVLAPAVSPTVALNYRDLNNLVYLQRMYDAGAGDCFDVLAAQGYGLFSGPTDYRLRPTVINYPHHLFLRDVMVVNGDADKGVWITEMGWNVVPDGLPQPFGQVTEAQQARYAVIAYERMVNDWPWIQVGNTWFLKRATDFETEQPFYYFRLLEPNFTRLPVYDALADALPESAFYEPRPSAWSLLDRNRRPLILIGAAWLFGLLLISLQPPVNDPKSD